MDKVATTLQSVNTPAILVDLDIARRNIQRFQAYADAHGLKVRPHIKTHKLPALAEMQLRAGAVGITCQKVSEAEAMVAGSLEIRDVLITYNILGREKLEHLAALARRVTLGVVADNETVIDGLSAAFAAEPAPLRVLVECNTGADRCGVADAGGRRNPCAAHRQGTGPRLWRPDDLSARERRGCGRNPS